MSFFGFRKHVHSGRRIRDKFRRGGSEQRPSKEEPPRNVLSPRDFVRFDGNIEGLDENGLEEPPRNVLSPHDYVRFDGNIEGLVVDENGLDVIYWRRLLEEENRMNNTKHHKEIIRRGRRDREGSDDRSHKEIISRARENGDGDGDGEEEEGKDSVYYKGSTRNKRNEPTKEIPWRRGRKPESSHSEVHKTTQDYNIERERDSSSSTGKISNFGALEKPDAKTQQVNLHYQPPHSPAQPAPNIGIPAPPLPPPPQLSPTPIPPPPPPPPPAAVAPPSPPPIPAKKGPTPPPPPTTPPHPPPIPAKKGATPPPPPPSKAGPHSKPPTIPKEPTNAGESPSTAESSGNQVKLKPLHWDKVTPDAEHSMVWHRIHGGSFNFDSDLMEALFGRVANSKKPTEGNSNKQNPNVSSAQTYILDPRKSQNTAIVLKSLGMTRAEIIDLLTDGHDVDAETLERLTRIAPTQEEQAEILEFTGDPTKLADAESFLFHLLQAVPSAFTRLNAILFKMNYNPEIVHHKESLQTLESACKELRARGLFVKLLEAILKAGNRMNAGTARGNAQAFNLTALRKLSDVKSIDGKTSLLHFVVEEVVRSEGKRCLMDRKSSSNDNDNGNGESNSDNSDASKEEKEKEYIQLGLPIVGGLSSEFSTVKKAAAIDFDAFSATCSALTVRVKETKRFLNQSCEGEDGFLRKMRVFLESAEEELKAVRDEQVKVMEFVKGTTDYYQAGALKDKNLFQLFVIIKDFLGMVDQVCNEIGRKQQKKKTTTATAATASGPGSFGPRNAVRFPILPPNFMSEYSRGGSSDSDSDS